MKNRRAWNYVLNFNETRGRKGMTIAKELAFSQARMNNQSGCHPNMVLARISRGGRLYYFGTSRKKKFHLKLSQIHLSTRVVLNKKPRQRNK